MSLQTSKEYSTAMLLEQSLNDYSWSSKKFAESIGYIHKTFQQTLVRTIIAVIKEMGSEHQSVDARNIASHELCKRIIDSGLFDDGILSMIWDGTKIHYSAWFFLWRSYQDKTEWPSTQRVREIWRLFMLSLHIGRWIWIQIKKLHLHDHRVFIRKKLLLTLR